jgi:hypothetical protein
MTLEDITPQEFENILNQDGHFWVNGERFTNDPWEWMECSVGDQLDLLGYGVIVVHELEIGKDFENYLGDDSYENWVILKVADRYFKKDGYYSSWDGGSLDGPWYEAKETQKTINVWEKKLDY